MAIKIYNREKHFAYRNKKVRVGKKRRREKKGKTRGGTK